MTGEILRVAVLGAGAVGCYYGGMLARAGHKVTLIGRPLHVDAFRKSGLHFEGLKFDEHVPVEASIEASAVRGARLVLFCVKSTDTEKAAEQIAPHLDAGAIVVNLQNGVDNTERIRSRVTNEVVPAAVYVATEMAGPGHLKHHGRGDLVIGPHEKVKAWFESAGVPVTVSDNVDGELWAKLVVNCAYNALSAITQLPYGRMIEGPGVRDLMKDVVEETLAVAQASGVKMAPDMLARTYRIAEAMPTPVVIHCAGSRARQAHRDRPPERLCHAQGQSARRRHARQPVPLGAGEAARI
jgi:2-dehydropantoate 2-reductase